MRDLQQSIGVGGRKRLPHYEALTARLEALEGAGVGDESVGGIAALRFRMFGKVRIGCVFPEDGLDAAHAAEAQFDVCVEEETLFGIDGAIRRVVFGAVL